MQRPNSEKSNKGLSASSRARKVATLRSFFNYLCNKVHLLPENPALVESIVSTDMAKAIASAYGVKLIEVLTGFKYIGEQMLKFEKTGCNNYVFGMEESYGCL